MFQSLNVATGVGSSSAYIEVGTGRTADGTTYIDLVSDSVTYTDHSTRFIRSSGTNGAFSIQQRGTGTLALQTIEAAPITLATTNVTRMTIAATGEIGIGAVPIATDMLYVNTTTAANTGLVIRGVTSQTGNLQEWQNTGGTVLASINAAGQFIGDGSQLSGIAASGETISSFLLMGA